MSIDATVIYVALPAIARDLSADVGAVACILNAYTLALVALLLVGGAAGDRLGGRRALTWAALGFAAASALCAAAPDITWLTLARVLQGAAAAFLLPVSLTVTHTAFAPGDRARSLGLWAGLVGLVAALGPLVGGRLVDTVSWRAGFLLDAAVALAVAGLVARRVPDGVRAPKRARHGDVALPGRARIALRLLTRRRSAAANGVTFLLYAALNGTFWLFVLQVQRVLGLSAFEAALAILPSVALSLGLAPLAARLTERGHGRASIVAGALCIAGGVLLASRIDPQDALLPAVLPSAVVFGAGLALHVAPLTSAALTAVPEEEAGLASAVNTGVARVAGLLAVALLPAIAGAADVAVAPGAFADAARRIEELAASLAVLAALLALLVLPPDAGRAP